MKSFSRLSRALSRGAHAFTGADGSSALLDRVSEFSSRSSGFPVHSIQACDDVIDVIAKAPTNVFRTLLHPREPSRRLRSCVRRKCRPRCGDGVEFILERRKVVLVTVAEIRRLFCPRLDEREHQIDGALHIARRPAVLDDS